MISVIAIQYKSEGNGTCNVSIFLAYLEWSTEGKNERNSEEIIQYKFSFDSKLFSFLRVLINVLVLNILCAQNYKNN